MRRRRRNHRADSACLCFHFPPKDRRSRGRLREEWEKRRPERERPRRKIIRYVYKTFLTHQTPAGRKQPQRSLKHSNSEFPVIKSCVCCCFHALTHLTDTGAPAHSGVQLPSRAGRQVAARGSRVKACDSIKNKMNRSLPSLAASARMCLCLCSDVSPLSGRNEKSLRRFKAGCHGNIMRW